MSFEWSRFLSIAEKMLNLSVDSSLEEACFRTSISRSYYSVYGVAANMLNELGGALSVPSKDAHKHVRETFSNGTTRVHAEIGTKMQRLWLQRKKADYDTVDYICNKSLAEVSVATAKRLQTLLDDHNARKF